MSSTEIENLGWVSLEDRGMQENNGNLFKYGDVKMRVWTTFPRFNFERNGIIIFDSSEDYPVDPTKIVQIPRAYLAQKMTEYDTL